MERLINNNVTVYVLRFSTEDYSLVLAFIGRFAITKSPVAQTAVALSAHHTSNTRPAPFTDLLWAQFHAHFGLRIWWNLLTGLFRSV